jgi:hypothetical protein
MIEVIIERWSGPDGTSYLWSVWHDGRRLGMGGPHADLQASEAEARTWCGEHLRRAPDRITRL